MQISEIVIESFNQPQAYQWIEQGRAHVATFTINDVGYWVKMYQTRGRLPPANNVDDMWVFNFGIDPEASTKLHGDKHAIMKPTGLRQQHSVISTVFAATDDFVSHVHPEAIWFSDIDHVRSRKTLYQKFAQHLINQYNYHFDDAVMKSFEGQSIWFLRAPEYD